MADEQAQESNSGQAGIRDGLDARGDRGPDRHGLQLSDRYIATTIRRDVQGEMPAFAQKHNDAEIAALLAYVRSLRDS